MLWRILHDVQLAWKFLFKETVSNFSFFLYLLSCGFFVCTQAVWVKTLLEIITHNASCFLSQLWLYGTNQNPVIQDTIKIICKAFQGEWFGSINPCIWAVTDIYTLNFQHIRCFGSIQYKFLKTAVSGQIYSIQTYANSKFLIVCENMVKFKSCEVLI